MGSMAEETNGDTSKPQAEVADPEQIQAWVEEGQCMLDRYKLKEAEELFHKILTHTDQRVKDRDKNVTSALVGLSEIYSKRARSKRSNDLEWHRMYMHSISSKRKALKCCENALEAGDSGTDTRWFDVEKQKAKSGLKVLEDCLVKSLQERLMPNNDRQTRMDKLMGIKKPQVKTDETVEKKGVDTAWLENFQIYVKEKFTTQLESNDDNIEEAIKYEEPPKLDRTESMESLGDMKMGKKKKINFDKVQTAIQKIVKQITSDMRHRQIHKDMTPEDKLTLMSPMADNFDLLGTFRKALYSDSSPEPEDSEDKDDSQTEEMPTGAESSSRLKGPEGLLISEERRSSLSVINEEDSIQGTSQLLLAAAANWKHSQENLAFNILSESSKEMIAGPVEKKTLSSTSSHRSATTAQSILRTHRSRYVEEEDVLKDVGVLRVWRSYKRDPSPDIVPPSTYKLQTYEELSPLTEVAGHPWDSHSRGRQTQAKSCDTEPQDLSVTPEAPVTEGELNLTLAHALTNMADRMHKKKSLKEASDLYIFALGIFQKNSGESTERSALKPAIGHIMQSLGMVKCSQGDFVGGSQLMEESINIFGKIKEKGADLSVARTWYELGAAFMAEQWKESTLFEHVMKAVKEVLEREVKQEEQVMDIDMDADSDDEEDNEGEAYWVSTQEAIGCFNHALEILRKDTMTDEGHHALYVDVLTKLGDCNIMTGNYEYAISCYEEALYMFKNIIGSKTLASNAHVLSMLGTTNFLVANFSKAVSMYECAHMLQQHVYGVDDTTFEVAFTLTMMGLTFFSMKRFHRSIAWCLKAFELYTFLYKEDIMNIDGLHRWFVTETLYGVGFSYGTLSFHEKALHYLGLAKCMVKNAEDVDVKQCVKILKAMADEYAALEDNENALLYYNEALELSQELGDESSASTLQNQLLNRMAGVHVNTKEYSTAALYLQQALDYQKNIENSIKDDLVGILRQLGLTYTLSGDVDRAIECYNDCLDAYVDIPGHHKEEMAQLMGTLGTLFHVKACIQDDNEDMENLLTKAERFYQDAMNMDSSSSVCVQYANYLYQQAQAGDALLAMLPVVHSPSSREDPNVVYNGVEQAVLPEHLQQEIDDMDEVALETQIFSKFLAILCYKQLRLEKDAEDCLVDLFKAVYHSDVALNHSILGYAMLEMSLFPEAAECFANAAGLQVDNDLAITNYWISLCLWSYATMTSSIRNIFSEALREAEDEWILESQLRDAVRKANQENQGPHGVRDSGYYDHTLDQTDEAWQPMEEITYTTDHFVDEVRFEGPEKHRDSPHEVLHRLKAKHMAQSSETINKYPEQEETFMDRGYTSNECLVERQDMRHDSGERYETWETIRKVPEDPESTGTWETEECETPAVILEMLQQQKELLNRDYQVHFNVGIIGDDEQEGDGKSATLDESNSHYANMVETPQSILHALEQQMVQEQRALEEVAATLDKEGFTSSVNQGSSVERPVTTTADDQDSYVEWVTTEVVRPSRTVNVQKKRTLSPESESSEEMWVTQEEVVETPMAILQALQHSAGDVPNNRSITQTSSRNVVPMELSPETETFSQTLESWTVEEPVTRTVHMQSLSSADQQHVIDSIHSWDSEGNHLQGSVPHHESEDIVRNNNYESHHQLNGDRTNTGSRRYDTWRTEETYTKPVIYRSADEEAPRTHTTTSEHSWADGRNGNGWPATKSAYYPRQSSMRTHDTYPQEQEQSFSEVWETSEETVETPPELLALLKAQHMQ